MENKNKIFIFILYFNYFLVPILIFHNNVIKNEK